MSLAHPNPGCRRSMNRSSSLWPKWISTRKKSSMRGKRVDQAYNDDLKDDLKELL